MISSLLNLKHFGFDHAILSKCHGGYCDADFYSTVFVKSMIPHLSTTRVVIM